MRRGSPVDGAHYGTFPTSGEPNVLMYNTDGVQGSAEELERRLRGDDACPMASPTRAEVQAYDGPIHVADAANYLISAKPDLGIKDPYELNEDQYKAASTLDRCLRCRRIWAHAGTFDHAVSLDNDTRALLFYMDAR